MGNAGVASTPDMNSQHWNPAKFAFIEYDMGASMSYTPWLRKLVNDINMYYLTGFMRLDEMQVLSASVRYFTLGEITYRTTAEETGFQVKPNEFALDLAYSRLLSERFSGSVAFRYIRSDLNTMQEDMNPGNSFAADLAFYFRTPTNIMGESSQLAAGINVSNIGNKISYDGVNNQFIPTNMRLGVSLDSELDAYNKVSFNLDLNKLLVPTPGFSPEDGTADDYAREYQDMSVTKAMFRSFSDAPGGMEEELQEISYALGAEYWYDGQFALRAGYFHEHENKGNRKHFTAGLGLKFNMMTLDASYIIPVVQNNPLANTIRFTLGIDLD
ncbi:type IX secretion system outer membrane channel protein PorV [Geofilum rubicundum]|uniref:Type IX secretion system protein PorV domain-containing protein n=1 Tax=Geofilum rubicundum JCM 15548 TaxID=1236989 RepID=A0A0E9LRG5_9BACT|nr:type IX secretion system outer membrane channel protein PorV [Geofilum rubicundum]GAO28182.1 hypothetical protein JCM15548_246 [Geofilum rubicundum JCM 15548]